MANALGASDLVIGGAGATSISEITALGKPSIIIPKAYTSENHQEYNAKSVENKGAGICILEKDLTGEVLSNSIFKILGDNNLLSEMSEKSKEIGTPKAIDKIYEEILKIYNENNSKKETVVEEIDEVENKEEKKEEKVIGIKKK